MYLAERQEILHSNQKLITENQYLLDVVDGLNRDLRKLEQIKQTLLFSIGPENPNQVTNVYDYNKVSLQTKLMNIANHSAENISNFVNLQKASEGGDGIYYNPNVLNQPYETYKKHSQRKDLQHTLRKGFTENLAKEAFSGREGIPEKEEEKTLSMEEGFLTMKKEKSKSS